MKTLRSQMLAHVRGDAGADDPLAGIVSFRAWLYSGDAHGKTFGAATDGHIKIRGDGYSSAHCGPCSVGSEEAPEEALIRAAGLDAVEAEIVRLLARYEPVAVVARMLRVSVRTVQRRMVVIRGKSEAYRAAVGEMGR